ncbi:nucleotidyltransferase [Paramagnetospirillum kuznetsovii]|uniref:Nucleotidyltransferase n=1 Tax=Paramagnetospirillum kuznetsovii TaxID=2053833 RepID=A0A364NXH7_9PROT|nr:nucleotidyltransferase domain-containing protein [Paramagnetospirillum kuznetsovii]RAU21788.1 nucleotidyltransferase [Paramagnetospirillum kuznetsovii]
MIRDDVTRILRARRDDLVRMGVVHAAIFGSVARGDERPDSDIDIMIEVDPAIVRGIFAIGGIQQSLEEWIGRSVDLARRDRLRPGIAEEAARDGVHAF